MIKAVIFDFDGTILDTETPWFNAFAEMYKEHGAALSMDVYSKIIGANSKSEDYIDPFEHLEEIVGEKLNLNVLRENVKKRHDELLGDQQIRPGVLAYLNEAKKRNFKIGLATSSYKNWVKPFLETFDLTNYFDTMVTADDVEFVKPDPTIYLKALYNLDVAGNEAIAFEDSPVGSRAALKAGIHTIIIPNTVTAPMNFDDGYHLLLNSFEEMSFSELIKTVN